MFKKILIANDGSEGAYKALVAALRLAHSHKAQVHMICVEEIPWMPAGSREEVIGEKEMADCKFAEVVAKAEAEAKSIFFVLFSSDLICMTRAVD